MGWSALLFGELNFPPGGVEAWKKLFIEEGLFKDKAWKSSQLMGEPVETATVTEMLAKLADHERWCDEVYDGADHQSIRVEGEHVSVRAHINEDDFRSYAGNIATMLRLAEKVGASGEYVALADDFNDGERLVLSGGKSRCELVDATAIMAGEEPGGELDYTAIIDELFERTTEKMRGAAEKQAPKAASAKTQGKKPKKATPKKPTPKKPTPKKPTPKKATPKKATPKKPTPKKAKKASRKTP